MSGGFINLVSLRPWWARLAILILVASPLLGMSSLPHEVRADHVFEDLAAWTAYAVFIWAFIWLVAGLEQLVVWLSISMIFGVTVAISGALIRKAGIWDIVAHLARVVTTDQGSAALVAEAGLTLKLLIVTISLPMAALTLHSFPASNLLQRAARPNGSSRMREAWVLVAIFLRVFQHVFEVAGAMLLAWREENPGMVIPRYKQDWEKGFKARLGFFGWLGRSAWVWSVGLFQHSVLIVPIVARDWGRFADQTE